MIVVIFAADDIRWEFEKISNKHGTNINYKCYMIHNDKDNRDVIKHQNCFTLLYHTSNYIPPPEIFLIICILVMIRNTMSLVNRIKILITISHTYTQTNHLIKK